MAAPKNPLGAKSDKLWRDAVMRAVRRIKERGEPQALEKLADSLVAKGLEGDVPALREIGDRLDGKPTQAITASGSITLTLESLVNEAVALRLGAPGSQPSVH